MTKKTILCIDDDSSTLAQIRDALESDYKLLCAVDPEVGLSLAVKRQPDLILLDVNIPGMNGLELADLLDKITMTSNIPIIFLSAFATPEIQERAEQLEAKAFLTKPCNGRHIREMVAKFLEVE